MIELKRITVGYLQVNCYLAKCSQTGEGIVIDPGADIDNIAEGIKKFGMKPVAVVLTHCHFDHAEQVPEVCKRYSVPLIYHEQERETALDPAKNLTARYSREDLSLKADRLVNQGDQICFGKESFFVLHTPGHTPGSLCLYAPGILISGDTLFRQNMGRSDFPGGDEAALARSIQEKLFVLPAETEVLPGHNKPSVIGFERENNLLALQAIRMYCRE